MHAPGDVRTEQRDDPKIISPADAVIRLAATCVCGSDLWPYRGIEPVSRPIPMGHDVAVADKRDPSNATPLKPCQFPVLPTPKRPDGWSF